MSDVRDRLISIVAKQLNIDESLINDGSDIGKDLHADSLDMVELTMAAEDEFGVDFSEENVGKIKTFGEAVAYVESFKGKSTQTEKDD